MGTFCLSGTALMQPRATSQRNPSLLIKLLSAGDPAWINEEGKSGIRNQEFTCSLGLPLLCTTGSG